MHMYSLVTVSSIFFSASSVVRVDMYRTRTPSGVTERFFLLSHLQGVTVMDINLVCLDGTAYTAQ